MESPSKTKALRDMMYTVEEYGLETIYELGWINLLVVYSHALSAYGRTEEAMRVDHLICTGELIAAESDFHS